MDMNASIDLPEKIQATYHDAKLSLRGPQGELHRSLPPEVSLQVNGNKIILESSNKAFLNTYIAHIKNMLHGVEKGYVIKLKSIFAHFPMTIEIKGQDILIKNFLGEKQPRKARLFSLTKLEVKGNEVFLKSPDKETLGLTLASLRKATRISNKDPRIFQDGFYIIEGA